MDLKLRFPNGLEKALSLSYDDGTFSDERMVSILKEYKIKCTFNLNGGMFGDLSHNRLSLEQAKTIFSDPLFEIASHGKKHLFPNKITADELIDEYVDEKNYLESNFGRPIIGGAYPYGVCTEELHALLKSLGYKYYRNTISSHNFNVPSDFLSYQPTTRNLDKDLFNTVDLFLNGKPHGDGYVFIMWGHAFEFDMYDSWNVLIEFCQKVSSRDDVWYYTNGELFTYLEAYKSLVVKNNVISNYSDVDVWVYANDKVLLIRQNDKAEL